MLRKLENLLSFADGKRQLFYAFLLGALAVPGLAPFYIWPLFLISFAGFLLLIENPRSKKQLFWTGWCYGFGYFTFGLYWISFALHIDIGKWWWLVPFALIGLPLVLSIYYGLAALCVWTVRHNRAKILLAALIAFSLAEFLRGYLFTGFPWNLAAYIWLDTAVSMQMSLVGAYGLTALTFALAVLLRVSFINKRYSIIFLTVLGVLWGSGHYIQARNISEMQRLPTDKNILIAQPNIPQIDKWTPDKFAENFETLLRLSSNYEATQQPDIIVWPETAIVWPIQHLDHIRPRLEEIINPGQILVSGILDYGEDAFHNSLVVFNDQAEIIEQYNKFHLVPFGEYVPFRDVLSIGPIATALETTGDFSAGQGLSTLGTGDLRFSPLICYEIIFPGRVYDRKDRPSFIINVTNDAWYLNSTGPYQHLSISRARAIETGLPVIRAANTGISALIDPNGKLVAELPLSEEGTLMTSLPAAMDVTFYNRYKELAFFSMLVILGFFFTRFPIREKK